MKRNAADIFSLIVGALLLVEGIWGFFSPYVFAVLTTNVTHAVIEVVLGVTGIVLGYMGRARGFVWFLGVLLLAVGVMRFLPPASQLLIDILNVNVPVAILNIIVAFTAFLTAYASRNFNAQHQTLQR